MDHVIIGAGKYSHAHIRVLNELGINRVILAKRSDWSDAAKHEFMQRYPTTHIEFNNIPNVADCIVHVVTPSDTHLQLLNTLTNAATIFVEKPSVLYNTNADFIDAKRIHMSHSRIYQNDWFSHIQVLRTDKTKPTAFNFTYNVVNISDIDLITEVMSHGIIFLSNWVAPDAKIELHTMAINNNMLELRCTIDDTMSVDFSIAHGLTDRSSWHAVVNDESFSSTQVGGKLLINTLTDVLTNCNPLTDWYKSSWLIHRFRLLLAPELFTDHFNTHYI